MGCIIPQYLVSILLWHLTWGWKQLFIQIICMWLLCMVVIPLRCFHAFFYTCILYVATSTLIMLCVWCVASMGCTPSLYDSNPYLVVYTDIQRVTFSFAIAYNILLYGIALLSHRIAPVPRFRLAVTIAVSGIMGALITPLFISFI
jgi:hypothetical protein